MKISAIVPALNEEKNVGNVLKVLLSSKILDEVILVDDGSTDKTAEIGEKLGAKVVKLPKNTGKGNAMKQGVKSTDADILFFSDADLVGLTEGHVNSLVEPMLKENIVMCVGVRDRVFGLTKTIAKSNFIMAIGGERVVKRDLFEKIPDKFLKGFVIETALNHFCILQNLPVKYVDLKNLNIIIKEKKWGFVKGFKNRLKMIWEIAVIRFELLFYKIK